MYISLKLGKKNCFMIKKIDLETKNVGRGTLMTKIMMHFIYCLCINK